MYSPFYCFTVYKKNERTVSDLNRQCLMSIIPIYWGQLDQRGIKGEEGGRGAIPKSPTTKRMKTKTKAKKKSQ